MDSIPQSEMVIIYISGAMFFVLSIYGVCCPHNNSSLQPHIAYSALTTAIMGVLGIVLSIISIYIDYRTSIPVYIFDGIGDAFMHLPGIIAFHNISLQRKSTIGKYVAYFGYAWTAVIAGTGQFLAVIFGSEVQVGYYFPLIISTVQFMHFAKWGLVAVLIVFAPMHLNQLQKKARITLLSYVILLSVSALIYTIIAYAVNSLLAYRILLFFFVTIPMIAAITISFRYGHLWTLELSEEVYAVEHVSIQDESRPGAIRNEINRPDAIRDERGKPDVIEDGRVKPNAVN